MADPTPTRWCEREGALASGHQHIDVTNDSYFADPFLFNCRNDPVQRAIRKAEQRAIRYAQTQGVTVVAAGGNQSDDLSDPTVDVISPDFPPGSEQEREVTNACVVVPVEIPGVVGVSANGRYGDSSSPQNGHMRPGQVAALLSQTANPQPCPEALTAGDEAFTQTSGAPHECQGGPGHNSWYGYGCVDARSAMTHASGNG